MTDFMNVIKELSKIDSPAGYEQAFAAKITEHSPDSPFGKKGEI